MGIDAIFKCVFLQSGYEVSCRCHQVIDGKRYRVPCAWSDTPQCNSVPPSVIPEYGSHCGALSDENGAWECSGSSCHLTCNNGYVPSDEGKSAYVTKTRLAKPNPNQKHKWARGARVTSSAIATGSSRQHASRSTTVMASVKLKNHPSVCQTVRAAQWAICVSYSVRHSSKPNSLGEFFFVSQ